MSTFWKAKLSHAMLTAGALLCPALTQPVQACVAIQNKADHTELRIVPAPGKVTIDGKMIATRYRPKIQDRQEPFAAYFETPAAGRESFDEIAEWNDLPMHYRVIPGGYVVEVAVPWSATALVPTPGLKFLADAGVIYGNAGGTRNAARAMWSDRTPEVSVNNDIPTECRLHPNGWGILMLE